METLNFSFTPPLPPLVSPASTFLSTGSVQRREHDVSTILVCMARDGVASVVGKMRKGIHPCSEVKTILVYFTLVHSSLQGHGHDRIIFELLQADGVGTRNQCTYEMYR